MLVRPRPTSFLKQRSVTRIESAAASAKVRHGRKANGEFGPAPSYRAAPERQCRYSPAICTGARMHRVEGNPDPKFVSTSFVERQNLNIRMSNRRMTRLTNAFSKKAANHAYMMAIYFMHYNFVRLHQTLKITPAMAAGVTDKLWEMSDMVKVFEDWEQSVSCR